MCDQKNIENTQNSNYKEATQLNTEHKIWTDTKEDK